MLSYQLGVIGDDGTYRAVSTLCAGSASVDGMTADFFQIDMGFVGQVAESDRRRGGGMNRVVYNMTGD